MKEDKDVGIWLYLTRKNHDRDLRPMKEIIPSYVRNEEIYVLRYNVERKCEVCYLCISRKNMWQTNER